MTGKSNKVHPIVTYVTIVVKRMIFSVKYCRNTNSVFFFTAKTRRRKTRQIRIVNLKSKIHSKIENRKS